MIDDETKIQLKYHSKFKIIDLKIKKLQDKKNKIRDEFYSEIILLKHNKINK
jgi:hypothetical protein